MASRAESERKHKARKEGLSDVVYHYAASGDPNVSEHRVMELLKVGSRTGKSIARTTRAPLTRVLDLLHGLRDQGRARFVDGRWEAIGG
jgi:hypothetical protein